MDKLKLHLEKAEEEALDHLVKVGLFTNRDEAARAAILKYAMDIGVLNRQVLWREMENVKRRKVTPDQLAKDLETLEDEN
jgi:Arc/MetJ-type ribon-helix-helix transcriptional regulator